MSLRLPLVSQGPTRPRVAGEPTRPRVAVSHTLLCVAGAGGAEDAALRCARGLVAALARHGRAPHVLLESAATGPARERPAHELQAAGARSVLVLPCAELPDAALGALAAIEPQVPAIGVGAELAATLGALLTIRVGRGAPAAGPQPFDLEIQDPAEAAAIASEIGAWLAGR